MRDSERRTTKRAKKLRRHMTDAEVILWSRLRGRAAEGFRFRRQHPIGPYIADFACAMTRLIVEVDGGTHSTDAELDHDRHRDAFLKSRGWRLFRVTNEDVYKRLDSVLEGICLHMPPPRPTGGPPP
ncbi:MAG TPA: endonuclease domain-containing protein [Rhizomicrobium sp.]